MHRATWTRPAVRASHCECGACAKIGIKRGTKRGSLTVLGIYCGHDGRGEGMRWTVQCECGAYDIRKTRTLHGRENIDDCCGFCNLKEQEFKKEFFSRNGRYPDFYEMPPRKKEQAA